MARPTIPDKDIPNADPETLIYCFTPWVQKIALRYRDCLDRISSKDMDDLLQVGSLALLTAQKKYDPEGGLSFLGFSKLYISNAMRRELGFTSDGRLPAEPLSLDAPLKEDSDFRLKDIVPDKTPTAEARIIEQDGHEETAEAVRAAVARLKNAKQKEVIRRVWFNGQDKQTVADEMEINLRYLQMIDLEARHKLRRDTILQQYAIPYFSSGLQRFRRTWTSVVEAAVIWREEHLHDGELEQLLPPERTWTPAQSLAYMRRRIRQTQEAQKEATS